MATEVNFDGKVNKVVYDGNTLIDLTEDTVTADKLAEGYTAHDKSGAIVTGTMAEGGIWDDVLYKKATAVEDTTKGIFYGFGSIKSVSLPNCTMVYYQAFAFAQDLESISLPKCTLIEMRGFRGCNGLKSIVLPECLDIRDEAFWVCNALETVDLHKCTNLGTDVFKSCSKLTKLFIRTGKMCQAGTQTFNNSKLKIYVPAALLDSYKSAPYWSTHASKFATIEDYEASATST